MTVHVCPEKDIVCGDRPDNWCQGCPRLQTSGPTAKPSPPGAWLRAAYKAPKAPDTSWLDTAIDWDFHGKPITRRDCILQQCGALALAYVEAAIEHHTATQRGPA